MQFQYATPRMFLSYQFSFGSSMAVYAHETVSIDMEKHSMKE